MSSNNSNRYGKVKDRSNLKEEIWCTSQGDVIKVSNMHPDHLINARNYAQRAYAFFKAKGKDEEAKQWLRWEQLFAKAARKRNLIVK